MLQAKAVRKILLLNMSSVELRASKEKAMAPHSSTLAWKIPWTEEPGRLQAMGSQRVGHDWATSLSLSCIGEGNGHPLQCSCLENPRDGRAWWAAVCGVAQSRTRLKQLRSSSSSKPGRMAAYAQKTQTFHKLSRKGLKGNLWDESYRLWIFFWLVDGEVIRWCFENLNHQPSGSSQPGATGLWSAGSHHPPPG